jgi:hypothetical protein
MVEQNISRNIHLAPYPTAAGPYRRASWHQVPATMGHDGRIALLAAGRRGARTLPPSATATGPYHCATRYYVFFNIFSFSFLKQF